MPIPENAVKELLSHGFLRLVASQAGFVTNTDELDFGVDLSLRHVEFIEERGSISYRASGFAIDVQLKATCEAQVEVSDDTLSYDLKAANFNDLVRRARTLHTIPLVLALFVLPDDQTQWLSLAASEMTLRRCAYVWRPASTEAPTDNTETKRIAIKLSDRVDVATFARLREEYLA